VSAHYCYQREEDERVPSTDLGKTTKGKTEEGRVEEERGVLGRQFGRKNNLTI